MCYEQLVPAPAATETSSATNPEWGLPVPQRGCWGIIHLCPACLQKQWKWNLVCCLLKKPKQNRSMAAPRQLP